MSNPNPNRHTNREARVPTTHKSFDALKSLARELTTNKMNTGQTSAGKSSGYEEGSGMQSGSMWTTLRQEKEKKSKESKHSSSSSGQPQRTREQLRVSGVSTQPSFKSANMSISHPSAPIHQNAPSHLTQRAWTIQRWTPGIWHTRPWENWTTAPSLAPGDYEFTMRTISMEEELGYGHHRPSRPELAEADTPSYIDRNLLVSQPWEVANELNFNSLVKFGKWEAITKSPDCLKATENLNNAAIKLIRHLEIQLDPRFDRALPEQEMERLLVNPRSGLSHAPIEKLSIITRVGDPLLFAIIQRFVQCGCPIKELRIKYHLTPEEKKLNKGKIFDPVAKAINELNDTINEIFAQRYAWGAGPEMQKMVEEHGEIFWIVKKFPKPMDIIYGV